MSAARDLEIDFNSVVNQKIKGKLVSRDVYTRVTGMANNILQQDDYDNAPFTVAECPECSGTLQHLFSHDTYCCNNGNCQFSCDDASEYVKAKEIYEWWICSDWLIEKLEAKGEPVIKHENLWGRTTTGQAILLDDVISEIAHDLEILEGMDNSWENII
jgi:hypothetical protein